MKVATCIIGLIVGLLVLMQSCTLTGAASLWQNAALTEAGQVGMLAGMLYFVGGAFAFGVPLVSAIVFGLAAIIGFAVSGEFNDMQIWAIIALALGAMSVWSWRSARKAKASTLTKETSR
jgi:hypothetical protein